MGYILYNNCKVLGGLKMPVISKFGGVAIIMYLRQKEHNPPHIHVMDPPNKQKQLIIDFINFYREQLMEMWETGQYEKLPPIK